MSFSFSAAGTPKEIIAEVGQRAANDGQIPTGFADAINNQLDGLPGEAEVTLSCNGHTGWHDGQTAGQISLHVTIDARLAQPAPFEPQPGTDEQPGPERFPEGFTEDSAPGRGAGEAPA